MLKNKKVFFIVTVLMAIFSFNLNKPVFAEESTIEKKKNYREEMRNQWLENKEKFELKQQERKAKILEKKDEIQSKRCEAILERVTKRIENYNDNKAVHVDNYARLYEKLSDIATTLKDKGYDISQLAADLVTFDAMVKEYASAYSAFIGKLEATQDYTCGESEGMFKQLLEESKEQLKMAIEKRQEIRAFYANTLRKDIQDIRTQIVADSDKEEVGNE